MMGRQAQELPEQFARELRELYDPCRGIKISLRVCAILARAHAKGWSYAALARALDASPEQARRLAKLAPQQINIPIDIPDAPAKKSTQKQRVLDPQELARLRRLHGLGG